MSKPHSIDLLSPPEHEIVVRSIRAHRYAQVNLIAEDIKAAGIEKISRSAIGRYVARVRARDEQTAQPDQNTIVTVVQRSTGTVQVIKTSASAETVMAQIAKI